MNHVTQGELWHVRIPESPTLGEAITEVTFINKLKQDMELYYVDQFYDEIY